MNDYKNHPLSKILPPLSEKEYESLKQDIKAHGFIDPVVLYENMILNGRSLYRAAKELKLEPKIKIFLPTPEMSAQNYVLSKIQGRQLTRSQMACIAVEVYNLEKSSPHGKTKSERDAQGKIIRKNPKDYTYTRDSVMSRFGIGNNLLFMGVRLKKEYPDVFERVKRGESAMFKEFKIHIQANPKISLYCRSKQQAMDNIARTILNVENKDLTLPNCFDSFDVIQRFMKAMSNHGWILELKMKEGKFYTNWYGNGRTSLEKTCALLGVQPEHDFKRAIVVSAKECLESAERMKAKAAIEAQAVAA